MKIKISHDDIEASFSFRKGTFDSLIIREIWQGKQYTLLPDFIPSKNDLVLDIGAHIGIFSVLAAKYGAEVLAYEPNLENYELLSKNLESNKVAYDENKNKRAGTVYTELVAVVGKAKPYYFYKGENEANTGSGFISEDIKRKEVDGEPVTTVSLSDILSAHSRKVFLAKIDVEGGEYDIVYDAPKEAFKNIERIIMEWHGTHEQGEQIRDYLVKLGYEVARFVGDNERGLLFLTRK